MFDQKLNNGIHNSASTTTAKAGTANYIVGSKRKEAASTVRTNLPGSVHYTQRNTKFILESDNDACAFAGIGDPK